MKPITIQEWAERHPVTSKRFIVVHERRHWVTIAYLVRKHSRSHRYCGVQYTLDLDRMAGMSGTRRQMLANIIRIMRTEERRAIPDLYAQRQHRKTASHR